MTQPSSRDKPLFIEEFSRDYVLVHGVEVVETHGETPEMDWALLETLEDAMAGEVIGKIGNAHYHFEASQSIPSKTVAVPDTATDNQLLLLK